MTIEQLQRLAWRCDQAVDPGPAPDAKEIVLRAEARSGGGRARRGRQGLSLGLARRQALAAAALVLIAVGVVLHQLARPAGDPTPIAAEEFVTGPGESTTARLNDGSLIRLGPESWLRVGAGGRERQVTLEGRAFFAIAPDESRPFRVVLPAGSVRVLGTRFHVEADLSNTRLIVLEGSVALSAAGREVHVRQDQMTELRAGEPGRVRVAPSLAELSTAWMGQLLVFQHTPLHRAAREIEQLYGVEVRIEDRALRDRTLTMWFAERPLEEVLTVVCTVIDATCRIEETRVTIGAAQARRSALDP